MGVKKKGSGRTSSRFDDAPEITATWISQANLYRGRRLVRRGRPKLANPRVLLSLRLPKDVLADWKASGPGWQTRMAALLERNCPLQPPSVNRNSSESRSG